MYWTLPSKTKIYEALGCIADKRITVTGNKAEVFSSSKNKKYIVTYDPETKSIMSNDNGSYWVGYLGYPAIAFLMVKGVFHYDNKCAEVLKDIPWKELNVKFKNDYDKTVAYLQETVIKDKINLKDFLEEIDKIYAQIKTSQFKQLGKRVKPPEGY